MSSRIRFVAWHVFKESVRDRVMYGIAAFAVLLVATSLLIGPLSAGQDIKIIKDLGLATIEIAGWVMTIFIGVGLVAREIERRSIFALLAKPLPRWEFIVGKYAGLLLTIAVNVAAMTIALFVVLASLAWMSPENVRQHWTVPATDIRLLVVIAEILVELALLTAVALFFSTFSSSALLSVVLTTGVLLAGLFSADLRDFGRLVDAPAGLATIVSTVGWAVPAFSSFDHKSTIVAGLPIDAGRVVFNLLYGLVYSMAALGGAVAVFSRREFR